MKEVVILDACGGNLRSVERALAAVGARPVRSRDPEVIARAERLVVPGQGAFAVFMRALAAHGLDGAVRAWLGRGRPYLGICLGLQILFDGSDELAGADGAVAGTPAGLGLIAGRIEALRADATHKVPHMGWNVLNRHRPDPLLAGVAADAHVYFVHSFAARPVDPAVVVASTDHGQPITAMVRHQHLAGCQFHPEKSQAVGLRILGNFVEGT
ncbi:MAG: imidazole glycerol phosphate synthase subunit HisH [Kofleriaceae bacterium]|nr:imidazole glycerol phosphate synthase subunit HisH [Kofleriaceae bacterium]MBP6838682.1 imidazole glycerol phosphate synthase subunit HisH [Kofleriaceae bacterium]MBP9202331.1 imidazole glycerol phosphate synthase subunit HisH [Kofleriaceae bacterium]